MQQPGIGLQIYHWLVARRVESRNNTLAISSRTSVRQSTKSSWTPSYQPQIIASYYLFIPENVKRRQKPRLIKPERDVVLDCKSVLNKLPMSWDVQTDAIERDNRRCSIWCTSTVVYTVCNVMYMYQLQYTYEDRPRVGNQSSFPT